MSFPRDFSVHRRFRIPPRTGLHPVAERNFQIKSGPAEADGDGRDRFADSCIPSATAEKERRPRLFIDCDSSGIKRQCILIPAAQYHTGTAAINGRVDDPERHAGKIPDAGLETGHVVGRSLIEPATPSISGCFVAEPAVDGTFQVDEPEIDVFTRCRESGKQGEAGDQCMKKFHIQFPPHIQFLSQRLPSGEDCAFHPLANCPT